MTPEAPATFAGYTEREWRDYAEGRYLFSVPGVCTASWDDVSWLAYIFGPRRCELPRDVADCDDGAPTIDRPAWAVYDDASAFRYTLALEGLGYCTRSEPTTDGQWLVHYWR